MATFCLMIPLIFIISGFLSTIEGIRFKFIVLYTFFKKIFIFLLNLMPKLFWIASTKMREETNLGKTMLFNCYPDWTLYKEVNNSHWEKKIVVKLTFVTSFETTKGTENFASNVVEKTVTVMTSESLQIVFSFNLILIPFYRKSTAKKWNLKSEER